MSHPYTKQLEEWFRQTDETTVHEFVENNKLSTLSVKEALKYVNLRGKLF
jgi:hypothetical protein